MRAIVSALILVLTCGAAVADEGMWRPEQLPALGDELRELGLELDPARLADLTAHPMGAVIWLGGCTASFVSPEGLIATNHHCAYGSIQYSSTAESNLLADGFLAATKADELPAAPGTRVYVLTEASDVTAAVQAAIPEAATGRARYEAIETAEKALVRACEAEDGYRCRVASFHGGLEYALFKQLEIRDVRLVYAPAGSVGKYGGDIDNWMWPRHTGDFSFYRAYVGPDGSPADWAEENVPFRPEHWLRTSVEGVAEGDFVMVAGYPGRTNRYRLAEEVANVIGWTYPTRREAYLEWLELIERETADRPAAAIAYASTIAGLNNASKNYEGMLAGFAKSDVVERKRTLEAELGAWIAADPSRTDRYGAALDELRALIAEEQATQTRDLELGMMQRTALLSAARKVVRLAHEREKPDAAREPGYQDRDLRRIRQSLEALQRRFDPAVDRAALRHIVLRYARLPEEQRVPEIDAGFGIGSEGLDEAALDERLEALYAGTSLGDADARLRLVDADLAAIEASDDPFIELAVALHDADMRLENEEKALEGRLSDVRPRVMAALIAFQEARGEAVYPDANGTLRLTYGTVEGYSPADAVWYEPLTTAAGVAAKATGEDPFDAPEDLLAAIGTGEWGPYASESIGTLPVNFLSTVDTTGGNSGSPTLDGEGRLVGLLFDGNWESIVSDWDFLPEVTRSIHVDMRYTLWVMDRVDGAWRLLREMGIEPAFETTGR